jgi:hypothetical protein
MRESLRQKEDEKPLQHPESGKLTRFSSFSEFYVERQVPLARLFMLY